MRMRMFRAMLALACACLSAVSLQGCVALLDAELNNRGGWIDQKLDDRWMIADTKQMRTLRAYVLIGSAIRMARPKYDSERKLIVAHANAAVAVASDAFYCAYAQPGRCIYFDERMVEAEMAVLRLIVAAMSTKDDQDLFTELGKQVGETFPILKSLDALTKAVDTAAAVADTTQATAKLLQNLITAGQLTYVTGRRMGALYRDSIELQMMAVISSLDAMCAVRTNTTVDYTSPVSVSKTSGAYDERFSHKGLSASERWSTDNFYGAPSELPDTCAAWREGVDTWHRGAGDLSAWKTYLSGPAALYRSYIIPNTNTFVQASDLVWRACEHLTSDIDERSECIGRTKNTEESGVIQCAVDWERNPREALKTVTGAGLNDASLKRMRANGDPPAEDPARTSYDDRCRLILYRSTLEQRLNRRSGADMRIDWLSHLTPMPSHPIVRRPAYRAN